jgi:hypothetical protein
MLGCGALIKGSEGRATITNVKLKLPGGANYNILPGYQFMIHLQLTLLYQMLIVLMPVMQM